MAVSFPCTLNPRRSSPALLRFKGMQCNSSVSSRARQPDSSTLAKSGLFLRKKYLDSVLRADQLPALEAGEGA